MSLTSLQNKGLKRHFRELEAPESKRRAGEGKEESDTTEAVANSIKGSKKRRLNILNDIKQSEAASDPNVVGFEVSLQTNTCEISYNKYK